MNRCRGTRTTNGDGSFSHRQILHDVGFRAVGSIDVADLDADGDNDLLSASNSEGTVAWYQNRDGVGDFSGQLKLSTRARLVASVFAADLDGDGDEDVLSAAENEFTWYENNGLKNPQHGPFGIEQVILAGVEGQNSIFAVDFDGDGDQDVLTSTSSGNAIAWFENTDGLGTFGDQNVILVVDSVEAIFAADLDGDGDADVLSANPEDDEILWFENQDGRGTFGKPVSITSSLHNAMDVRAADLDGDGDSDVLAISKHFVVWYENADGKGSFGPQQIISRELKYGTEIDSADLDGDGDLDVVSAATGDDGRQGGIAWYENMDGRGTFGAQQRIVGAQQRIGSRGQHVHAADFDNDGDVDLISARARWAYYHENIDALGTFATPQLISDRLLGASSIFVSDVDSDGDFDALIADRVQSKVTWFENRKPGDSNGDGQFDSSDLVAVFRSGEYEDGNNGNSTFEEGDWNGDGDFTSADLVLAFRSGGYVRASRPSILVESIFAGTREELERIRIDKDFDAIPAGESPTCRSFPK